MKMKRTVMKMIKPILKEYKNSTYNRQVEMSRAGIDFNEVDEIQVSLKNGKTMIYRGNGLNVFRREVMQSDDARQVSAPPSQSNEGLLTRAAPNSKYQQRDISYNFSNKTMEQQIAEMKQSCAERGIQM